MTLQPEIELSVKLERISESHEKNRNTLRKLLLDKLIAEKAGTGNKEKTSKYRYNVESLSCGNHIYITRTVPLNKGFDFIIHVENYSFINGKDNPRHDDILNDLKKKKKENDSNYKKLLELINLVYLCNDPDDIVIKDDLLFQEGFSIDLILKVIKWLFIEQDIRYWNWSGRNMFMTAIRGV